jgi:hypothetical protein
MQVTDKNYLDSIENKELGKLYLAVIEHEQSANESMRIGHRIRVAETLKKAYESNKLIHDFFQSIEIDKSDWSLELELKKHIIGTEIKSGEIAMNVSFGLTLKYPTFDTEKEIYKWQLISRKHFDKAHELSYDVKDSCYSINVRQMCKRCYGFLDMGVNISFNKEPIIKEPVQDTLF